MEKHRQVHAHVGHRFKTTHQLDCLGSDYAPHRYLGHQLTFDTFYDSLELGLCAHDRRRQAAFSSSMKQARYEIWLVPLL
jgi:hypothetical protein